MKTISLLNERGIVTTNFEDKGFYYTNLYVGAPKEHKNALISWVRSMEDDYLEKSSSESK